MKVCGEKAHASQFKSAPKSSAAYPPAELPIITVRS
jgi:hypothetical protein